MPTDLFCKDCKFYMPSLSNDPDLRFALAKCSRPKIRNVVTGEIANRHCSTERCTELPDLCGPSGKFFEPDNSDITP